ncbi:ABC transporter substrate-binding protein [Halorubrum trueperi]|uniref:ABC transporter substrate-binding protein n=1 Tax=Halorubrum trueperi TaxID=2004704 RepID=A0ABD5UKB8_9EURY
MVDDTSADGLSRREYLNALGIASATTSVGLAGCSGLTDDGGDGSDGSDGSDGGDGGDGGGAAGERVPTLDLMYWSDLGAETRYAEQSVPSIVEYLESIGLDVETTGMGISNQVADTIADARVEHINLGGQGPKPSRLDPDDLMMRYNLSYAGNNDHLNNCQYASCEYTELVFEQRNVMDEDERQEIILDAMKTMSEDVPFWPVTERFNVGMMNTDELEPGGIGDIGLREYGNKPWIETEAKTDKGIITSMPPALTESKVNNLLTENGSVQSVFNHLIHTSLLEYDENYNQQAGIAEDYQISDDGLRITFELADATFHDGSEITAEDVKFTYEFITENVGQFPLINDFPLDRVEVDDEKTATFYLSDLHPPFITREASLFGILSKEVWEDAGAWDNPTSPDMGEIVGSGPYAVTDFTDTSIFLEPVDDHPIYDPKSEIILQTFDSAQAAIRAFDNGEINDARTLSASVIQDYADQDNVRVVSRGAYALEALYPQNSYGPGMFQEFREAGSWALNRDEINEIAVYGGSTTVPYALPYSLKHPWISASDLDELSELGIKTQSSSGDQERARQILEDAGWTWDDDDRLHYPEGADLTPAWPEGSQPSEHPEDFPCVEDLQSEWSG